MFSSTPGAGAAAGVGSAGGAGGANVREVTYRVKVVADTSQANAAFAGMGQHAQAAAQAAQAHQQRTGMTPAGMTYLPGHGYVPTQMANGMVPGYGMPGGGGGAGGGAGGRGGVPADTQFLNGFASFVARLGTAVAAVTMSLDAMQKVVHATNLTFRDTVNARAKMEAWFDAVPVVGPTVGRAMSAGVGLWERYGINGGDGYGARAAANGNTFKAQQALTAIGVWEPLAAVAGEFGAAEFEASAAEDFIARSPFEVARMQAAAQARRRQDELGGGFTAMSEAAGYRSVTAAEEAKLLFAGKTRGRTRFDGDDSFDAVIRSAERGKVAAGGAVSAAEQEAFRARMGREDALREVDRKPFDTAQANADRLAEKAKTDATIQGTLTEAIVTAEREQAKYAEQLARYQEALNKEKEKAVGLAQAEYELNQKSLAVQQARLSVAEQKLKQNDSYAESYAMMNGSQRQGLADAARQLQDGDFDSLSPRQRELLGGSSMTSEFFRKKSREFVNGDPELRGGLDELLRLTGQQTRTELTQERNKLQAQVELEFVANTEKLATALKQAFRTIDPELAKLIGESLKVNNAKTAREEAAANAQRKN